MTAQWGLIIIVIIRGNCYVTGTIMRSFLLFHLILIKSLRGTSHCSHFTYKENNSQKENTWHKITPMLSPSDSPVSLRLPVRQYQETRSMSSSEGHLPIPRCAVMLTRTSFTCRSRKLASGEVTPKDQVLLLAWATWPVAQERSAVLLWGPGV